MATRPPRNKEIVLTLSMTMEPDFYDVANALCTVLLKQPKIDDVLMLESIMRTSLQSLKKRGFNVDRILNAQREEHLRKQAEAVKEREAHEASKAAALTAAPPIPAPPDTAVEAAGRQSIKGAGAPIPKAPGQAVSLLMSTHMLTSGNEARRRRRVGRPQTLQRQCFHAQRSLPIAGHRRPSQLRRPWRRPWAARWHSGPLDAAAVGDGTHPRDCAQGRRRLEAWHRRIGDQEYQTEHQFPAGKPAGLLRPVGRGEHPHGIQPGSTELPGVASFRWVSPRSLRTG